MDLVNKQKGLAPILIILLIALAVGGYLVYQKQLKPVSVSQPSPSPITTSTTTNSAETTTWKTYTNSDFLFKYPSGYTIEDNKNPNFKTELANIVLIKKLPELKEDVEMIFIARTHTDKPEFSVLSFDNKQEIIVDGIDGVRSFGYGGEAGRVYKITVQLTRGNIEYYILGNNYNGIEFKDFDQILSTFKFTQ